MNLLHWFFEKLEPRGELNWLSVRFARWKYSKLDRHNEYYLKQSSIPERVFKVAGAGTMVISETANHSTGQSYGFGISVSWSENGLGIGGVLGIDEARKLATHIQSKCDEITLPEAELVKQSYSRMAHQINPLVS